MGKVRGDDSLGTYDFQTNRNLRFESQIYEGYGLLEFNFLPFRPGRTNKGGAWTPFVFAGISLFHFAPEVNYNGTLVDLASLNTEGQNLPGSVLEDYGRISMAVPFGAGIKLKLSNRFSLMTEWACARLCARPLGDTDRSLFGRAHARWPSCLAVFWPLGYR